MRGVRMGAVLLTLTAACATVRVEEELSPSASFARYRTFVVRPGEVSGPYRMWNSGPLAAQVNRALRDELVRKGLREDPQNPDLIARWIGGEQTAVDVQRFGPAGWGGLGRSRWWGPGYGYWAREHTESALWLELIDADTQQIIWRGRAVSETLPDELTAEKVDEHLRKVVRKLLANIPPPGLETGRAGARALHRASRVGRESEWTAPSRSPRAHRATAGPAR